MRYVKAKTLVEMVHENLAQTLGSRLKNVKFETMGMSIHATSGEGFRRMTNYLSLRRPTN